MFCFGLFANQDSYKTPSACLRSWPYCDKYDVLWVTRDVCFGWLHDNTWETENTNHIVWFGPTIKFSFFFSLGEAGKVFRTFILWQRPAEFKQKRQHKFSEMTRFYPDHWYTWNSVGGIKYVKNIQCFEENYLLAHLKMFFIKCHHASVFWGKGFVVLPYLELHFW